jgi:hypothetical protein
MEGYLVLSFSDERSGSVALNTSSKVRIGSEPLGHLDDVISALRLCAPDGVCVTSSCAKIPSMRSPRLSNHVGLLVGQSLQSEPSPASVKNPPTASLPH